MWLPPVAHSKRPQANSAQPVSVRFVRQVGPATPCMLLALILSSLAAQTAYAWRQHRPWNTRPWCSEVVEPSWPFAYAKLGGQTVERKGRTASNLQHMGHECTTAGARSKCFRCEDFSCGPDLNSSCAFQVQGVPHTALPPSVPTVHDTPFAVGDAVRHRMDFGRAARTCVVLSGGRCLDGSGGDFSGCRVRCWGAGRPPPTPTATGWEHSKLVGQPQGRVFTLAGSSHGQFGHADGNASTALFNRPQGVHMNEAGQVFVADTDNHVIRLLDTRTGIVRTIAGVPGQVGYADGEGSVALFSHPVGVVSWRDGALQHVAVADTGNHRIRELVFQGGQWLVSTLAGGGEDLPLVLRAGAVKSHGFADGVGTDARFDSPRGMAVSGTRLYVADTNNHLIRRIFLKDGPGHQRGQTETYVGTVRSYPVSFLRGEPLASSAELPGCSPPCEEGVQGYVDATLNTSQLYHPYDVAIGEAGDNSAGEDNLIIVDGDRIRMAFSSAGPPVQWLGIASENRVVTLAGTTNAGESDGVGVEASFRKPRAAAVDAEGRVYVADAGSCRLRRLSPARRVAKPISCDATLDDVVQPSGCAMYDPALDAQDRTATSAFGHITYNYHHSRLDGKQVKECVGTPPPDAGIQSNASTLGPYAGTGWEPFLHKEDTGDLTTLRLRCPSGCAASPAAVAGDGLYAGTSSICKAAVHAGVLLNDAGGMVTVQVQRGVGERAGPGREGLGAPASSRFGVQSAALASADRTFNLSVYPLHVVEVQTIAGAPNAPIEELCGFQDSQPPMGALFNLPSGISLDASAVLGNTTYMVVADTDNHALRGVTAVCSQPCENGGRCVAPETCMCPRGWSGPDCATPQCSVPCSGRTLCTAPDTCTCVPGFTGQACDVPQCVQHCAHGGVCSGPDTCTCAPGWFDANCTTPVCSQTCGNGGNCTAPGVCSCPTQWTGHDCRQPVCTSPCQHGHCVAPDTCRCEPGWAGFDCSKPVCTQGFFRRDPTPAFSDSPLRPLSWTRYVQCDFPSWCNSTNEFDCRQRQRSRRPAEVSLDRATSGRRTPPPRCMLLELGLNASTPFRYVNEEGSLTGFWRTTPRTPYGWGPTPTTNPWSSPGPADPDRQLAQVALEDMDEGVYVCANGGNCTAPDACVCAPGWAGFDCRTPTCTNGYFDPQAPGLNPDPRFPRQGMYEFVNDRTVTIWENFPSFNEKFPGYMQEHPNYFSRFNGPLPDGNNYPVMYEKRPSLPPGDNTYEGWRRSQWWELARGAQWSKGRAAYTVPRYRRHCPGAAWKAVDLQTGNSTGWVLDTAQAYSPRIDYSDPRRVHAVGRWEEGGGECVDQVERGCFNGGTCTGPLTCSCLGGWEGDDCTLPICAAAVRSVSGQAGIPATRLSSPQERSNSSLELLGSSPGGTFIQYRQCANNGNCTHPETCTCAMGWSGPNCTVPLCAQECMHGGTCIAPDTCKCPQWSAQFTDRRGQPYFKRPDGTSQLTGWTGFDCSTPICVQHERFILNNVRDPVRLSHTLSDGSSFQSGCSERSPYSPLGSTRISSKLCLQEVWYQGNYEHPWAFKNPAPITWESHEDVSRVSEGRNIRVNHPNYIRESPETWVEGPVVEGEGLYACFNDGSCVAPDTCVCAEGWTGYDCNTPTCTPKCLRGGVCGDKDTCVCPRWPSRLHEVHPDVPQVVTGFNGSDCSMSMCAQGFLEPNCSVEARQLAGLTGDQTACYMCANGGVCTAPDTCTCTAEWKGFDCKTPVCRAHADVEILEQLNTVDPAVVTAFEQDPCLPNTLEEFLPENTWKGRGNCTAPNVCTCLCRDLTWFDVNGIQKEKPWVDELGRPLLPDQVYGRHTCLDGFEGAQDSQGRFTSCHLRIKVPTFIERYSIVLVAVVVTITVIVVVVYSFVRYQLLRRAKEYRRRRRRQRDKDDEDVDLEKEAQKVRMSKKAKKASSSAKKRKKRSKSKSKSRSKSD